MGGVTEGEGQPLWARSSGRSRLFIVTAAVFVSAGFFNALTKGGDFTVFLEAGRRFWLGEPLYAGSRVAEGIVGPPFQAVFFLPFAWLAAASEVASRLAWYAVNLVALVAAVTWWASAVCDDGERGMPWQRAFASDDVLVALVAVSHPLIVNFQHQNLSLILLAATGAAAVAVRWRSDASVAAWLGGAVALKAFPALLMPWIAVRGRYRGALFGVAVAVALTALPVLRYGAEGWTAMMRDWWSISGTGGWPVRSHNQSLFAMVGRWLGPEGITATGDLALSDAPGAYAVWLGCVAGLLGFCGWRLARRSSSDTDVELPREMAIVLGLAVLASPIAWDHYWVLFFPAFLLARTLRPAATGPLLSRTFWVALVLTSGPLLFPREVWRVYRWVSGRTLGGILLLAILSVVLAGARDRREGSTVSNLP